MVGGGGFLQGHPCEESCLFTLQVALSCDCIISKLTEVSFSIGKLVYKTRQDIYIHSFILLILVIINHFKAITTLKSFGLELLSQCFYLCRVLSSGILVYLNIDIT